jgi:ABC-type lipoprotein release transport system permease subunit
VPDLEFYIDDTLDEVFRMEELFKKIKEDDKEYNPEPSEPRQKNMLAFKIALRYLFQKSLLMRSISSLPCLWWAWVWAHLPLIVVLHTFNGFENLAKSLYNSFYADITVSAIKGKTFADDKLLYDKLRNTKGVIAISKTLEEHISKS